MSLIKGESVQDILRRELIANGGTTGLTTSHMSLKPPIKNTADEPEIAKK